MPTGYTNHYLRVDLSTGQVSTFALAEDVLERYVGGKGIGAYLLARRRDPMAAPYDPANPLIWAVGLLTGTQAPSRRSVVVFQSPVTHLFNLKAGMTQDDEDLPARFKEEPLPDGPAAGHRYTDEDIEWLRADYYRVRGWDEHGVPKPETLAVLGVEYPNA